MELVSKIEDAMREAEALRSLLLAVEEAIYNGYNSYKDYEDALNWIYLIACDHAEGLKLLTDKAYESWKGLNREVKSDA